MNFGHRGNGVWLRSSAASETIQKRGQLESLLCQQLGKEKVHKYLDSLFSNPTSSGLVGVVVQTAINKESLYHFSNERRFSPTKNQWEISNDNDLDPYITSGGCNSKQGTALTETHPLIIRPNEKSGSVRALMRGIGRWANSKYHGRIHFEILRTDAQLFLVQIDHEIEIDGVDPKNVKREFTKGNASEVEAFTCYKIGEKSRFRKLANIDDFAVPGYDPPHQLFWCQLDLLHDLVKNHQAKLYREIDKLTGGKLVLREDIDKSRVRADSFNLARTDTVTAAQAIHHIQARIKYWLGKGEDLANICIIMHGFIPAQSSAWAMYDRKENRVRIHALWGLPDGLQFLTPDEYEFDIGIASWSERTNFKEFFLQEQMDGSWKIVPVLIARARGKVLSKSQAVQIANLTIKIGKKLDADVHIMFFCGIPKEMEMGEVLPWFRARETAVYEEKRERRLRKVSIKNISDLDALELPQDIALSLEPEIENYRNNEFIKFVARFAVENDLPVEIQGSPLAHAYYMLKDAGCTVFLAHARKNQRVRNKQKFGKLVRDKIVDKIEQSGEGSLSFKLSKAEKAAAFFGKVVEESIEVINAPSGEEQINELADLYETVIGWIESYGLELNEVTTIAAEKRKKAGGFNSGEVLVGTGIKLGGISGGKHTRYSLNDVTHPTLGPARLRISAARLGLIASGNDESVLLNNGLNITISIDDEAHLQLDFSERETDENQLKFDI